MHGAGAPGQRLHLHGVLVHAAVRAAATTRMAVAPWAVALFAVLAASKTALLVLRVADGAPPAATPWLAIALLHEDVRLVVAFAAVVALATAVARVRPDATRAMRASVALVYAALVFWTAVNVPVARELSSPLTFSLIHATGGAIRDSIARYATPLNLGLPVALCMGALVLPRLVGGYLRPSWRAHVGLTVATAAAVALGPMAARRASVSGFHRNAVLALVETVLARHDRDSRRAPPPLTSAACRPVVDPGAADLTALAGLARGRNVIWVILESTGARALPIYGAARDVTPHLSDLAARAVVFDTAYAAYPESIKGLFSILCGRAPPPGSEASELPRGRVACGSVAEAFTRAGIRAGLFHSGWFAYLGMDAVVRDRGFDVLVDAGGIESPHRSSFGVDDRATARRLLAFVDGVPAGQRFFAVFMPIAGHHPYHAPGVAPRPWPEANDHDAYLNDLSVADDAFGIVREGLRSRGLDGETVYVVVGDHGEAFREHAGNLAHALYLYEENVRVPFFIAAPGAQLAPRRAPQLASLIDLAPTTLALAALPPEPSHEGRSLLTPSAPRVARFFTEQGARRIALRDGRWKVLLDADVGRTEVYDLASDPAERDNRSTTAAQIANAYRLCLGF